MINPLAYMVWQVFFANFILHFRYKYDGCFFAAFKYLFLNQYKIHYTADFRYIRFPLWNIAAIPLQKPLNLLHITAFKGGLP